RRQRRRSRSSGDPPPPRHRARRGERSRRPPRHRRCRAARAGSGGSGARARRRPRRGVAPCRAYRGRRARAPGRVSWLGPGREGARGKAFAGMIEASSKIVGCDVGGTFTDLILYDEASRKVEVAKVPTTPANQAEGVLAALEAVKAPLAEIAIVHGTTTTTNALLERKIARCGLITTKGFRDILELGRRTRPQPYGLIGTFEPLIPREMRLEVTERIDAEGVVLQPLDLAEVERAVEELMSKGMESLVIHFLHSYL